MKSSDLVRALSRRRRRPGGHEVVVCIHLVEDGVGEHAKDLRPGKWTIEYAREEGEVRLLRCWTKVVRFRTAPAQAGTASA